jgi:Membrane domain of glycerophosphoryl diester phosphodiesterase
MTDIAAPTGREFRIGPIFTRSWSIYAANFLKFTLVAVVIALPNQIIRSNLTTVIWATQVGVAPTLVGSWIIALILEFIGQGVILYGAFQAVHGHPVVIGAAFRRWLSRFWAIIGISILVFLGLAIGFALLIIPGVIMALRWAVTLPVCMVEGKGPLASMRRSAELTKGHRWKLFGIGVLIYVVAITTALVRVLVVGLLAGSGILGGLGLAVPGGIIITAIISLILSAIVIAYFNVVAATIYHDLRGAKEGVDTEQIATVFD